MNNRLIGNAMLTGIVPAVVETALILFADPSVNRLVLVSAVLFWFSCGFVIFLLDVGLPVILQSVVFTVLLCLPWYITESIIAGKPEHLLPLIIASIVQGVIIGILTKKLKKKMDLKSTSLQTR